MDAAVNYIGAVGIWPILMVLAGVALLITEMFVPGFGIPGVTGTLLSIAGIILWARNWEEAVLITAGVLVALVVAFLFVMRSAQTGRLSRSRIILTDSMQFGAGYSNEFTPEQLIGKTGVAVSELRPAGIGMFDTQRIDVVSDGEYISRGSTITIVRLEGRRIIVKLAEPDQKQGGEETCQ
ncbi:MAG: NfeD family protein [Bacillota bacterium]